MRDRIRATATATVPPPRDSEPEPQHDRAGGNPDALPPLPQRIPGKSL